LNASEDFKTLSLIKGTKKERVKIIIEHMFEGSRYRYFILDDQFKNFIYRSFVMLLAGGLGRRMRY